MNKTASGLVEYCKAQLGKPYWYGTFGQRSSKALYESKKKQYPRYYTASDFKNQLGEKVHDCIGLIKGYIWSSSNTDISPKYASNGCPDVNEEMMYNYAKEKGSIGTMPDILGVCVLMKGHIGVYIGNGEVIEAKGHNYGVVKTKLKGRGWTKWCKCPYIIYDTEEKATPAKKPATNKKTYSGTLPKLPKDGSIKSGVKGGKVKKLQRFLNWYGNYKLAIDGKCGPLTVQAIRKYQSAEELSVDGKFGPLSLKAAQKYK